jgi:ABC-type phosphate transport system permease subunit
MLRFSILMTSYLCVMNLNLNHLKMKRLINFIVALVVTINLCAENTQTFYKHPKQSIDTASMSKKESRFGGVLLIVGAGVLTTGIVIISAPVSIAGGVVFIFALGLKSQSNYIINIRDYKAEDARRLKRLEDFR